MKPAWTEVHARCKHCHKPITGYLWPDGEQRWRHDGKTSLGYYNCITTHAEPEGTFIV